MHYVFNTLGTRGSSLAKSGRSKAGETSVRSNGRPDLASELLLVPRVRFQNHVILLNTDGVSLPQTMSGDSTVNEFSEYQKKLPELFVQ